MSPARLLCSKLTVPALAGAALVFLALQLFLLGGHQDSEFIFTPENAPVVEFSHASESSFFVCGASKDAVSGTLEINWTASDGSQKLSRPIEISEARPLDAPASFGKKYHLEDGIYCGVSDPVQIPAGRMIPTVAPNSLVIDAHSEKPVSAADIALFLAFLVLLWSSVALSTRKPPQIPSMKFYDGIVAFVAALIVAFGLSSLSDALLSEKQDLLPSFGQMFGMLGSNFAAFILVAALCLGVRFKNAQAPNAKSSDPPAQSAVKTILVPSISAVVLVALAMGTVLVAPLPGLSVAEIASQLVSTRFMTAHFAVLAGVCEELLFRGVIQTGFMANPGSRYPRLQNCFAVGMTTLLFVALHVPQSMEHLWALAPIALVSVVSGILRIRSGSVSQSILLHMTYNALLLLPTIFLSAASL